MCSQANRQTGGHPNSPPLPSIQAMVHPQCLSSGLGCPVRRFELVISINLPDRCSSVYSTQQLPVTFHTRPIARVETGKPGSTRKKRVSSSLRHRQGLDLASMARSMGKEEGFKWFLFTFHAHNHHSRSTDIRFV
ncbi:unnamed protein product [Protopolystoma xenopodis]|uniref:Uncharacterized protein n=1 Tax=Protopolystoma xenopodis TaxID=117903 RepID=A0A448X340_9PLAT|nr:unnamed protein product [Protopolystoma xenopodis]